VDMLHWLSVLI